jgi:oxygen-independent coproporphyrinogen-3 oxidase
VNAPVLKEDLRACTAEPLALYIHWPFCVSKCPYCDFNSHVRETIDQDQWREALLADLAHEARLTPGRTLGSIFFGGGTPSLMPPSTAQALIDAAALYWRFDGDVEITLEANPSSVEASRFADLALAGVNRLSLGVQSLDEEALRFLGRAHGVDEALGALAIAQARFARVSFDLIYALPGQNEANWRTQLDRALGFGTGHLSLYQLTIEPGTRFAALAAKGELHPVPADVGATFYEATQELTEAAGLPAYEISNHARPGEESRHNLAYWRYRDYCGVGPGAHGRRGGKAMVRHKKPENWLAAIARDSQGIAEETALAPDERATEAMLMGLRLSEGIDLGRLASPNMLNETRTAHLQREGLILRQGSRLQVTPKGRLLLEAILPEILN